jgi:hypothetical protein
MKRLGIALLLGSGAPAVAQNAPSPAAVPAAAKPNPLDKIICRTEDSLGSRLNTQRVCMTLREWKDEAEANRKRAEEFQQNGSGLCREGCSSTAGLPPK